MNKLLQCAIGLFLLYSFSANAAKEGTIHVKGTVPSFLTLDVKNIAFEVTAKEIKDKKEIRPKRINGSESTIIVKTNTGYNLKFSVSEDYESRQGRTMQLKNYGSQFDVDLVILSRKEGGTGANTIGRETKVKTGQNYGLSAPGAGRDRIRSSEGVIYDLGVSYTTNVILSSGDYSSRQLNCKKQVHSHDKFSIL